MVCAPRGIWIAMKNYISDKCKMCGLVATRSTGNGGE